MLSQKRKIQIVHKRFVLIKVFRHPPEICLRLSSSVCRLEEIFPCTAEYCSFNRPTRVTISAASVAMADLRHAVMDATSRSRVTSFLPSDATRMRNGVGFQYGKGNTALVNQIINTAFRACPRSYSPMRSVRSRSAADCFGDHPLGHKRCQAYTSKIKEYAYLNFSYYSSVCPAFLVPNEYP
jgi:hypothetical protein